MSLQNSSMWQHSFKFSAAWLKTKTKLILVNVQICILTSFWLKWSESLDPAGQFWGILEHTSIISTIFQRGTETPQFLRNLLKKKSKIFMNNLNNWLLWLWLALNITWSVSLIPSGTAILEVISSYALNNAWTHLISCSPANNSLASSPWTTSVKKNK